MPTLEDFCISELPLWKILAAVYGVGRTKSWFICKRFGVSPQAIANSIDKSRLHWIREFVETKLLIGDDVRKVEADTVRRYIENNSNRGRRLRRGLPVRGQRTRANGQTAKRRKGYFLQFLK